MPIKSYDVVDPPTSAEVAVLALAAEQEENIALRGLLDVVVRSKNQPVDSNEPLRVSIRYKTYDSFGHVSAISGPGTLNPGTEASTHSSSVRLRLSTDNTNEPAQATLVL